MKTLIVDDDASSRKLLARILLNLGFTTLEASNGERALHMLEDNADIECVFTDIVMPKMDGLQLLKILEEDPQFRLPVVAMSGKVGMKTIRDILSSGAFRFLPKPLRKRELQEVVEALLAEVMGPESAQKVNSLLL